MTTLQMMVMIVCVIIFPLALICGVNLLIECMNVQIPFNFWTWCGAVIVLILIRGNVMVEKC